jgi:hypothetical protein
MASRQLSRFLLALAAAIGVLAPWAGVARADEPTLAEAHYDPNEYPPPGTRTRLLLTGAGLTVGWYAASVGTSYLWKNAPNAKDQRIPVVGPWLALRDVGCGPKEPECETAVVVFRTAVTVISGVGQLGGLIVLWEGLFLDSGPPAADAHAPKAASARDQRERAGVDWAPSPIALPDGSLGLGVVGRF